MLERNKRKPAFAGGSRIRQPSAERSFTARVCVRRVKRALRQRRFTVIFRDAHELGSRRWWRGLMPRR
ncbi:hypothetical protein KCP69_01420 [Salmonella enterica subsp. enterica]|nr:hypothetical protein KCP69_01420 [Salmonella enterica subsp. enterica]